MWTLICIMILAYLMMGKNVDELLEKVKHVDWQSKMNELYAKLRPYALKAGRVSARPLLQFYYVMEDPQTTTKDKVMIYAAILYTISPVNFLPRSVYGWLGVLDEGAAILFVYKKVKSKITPEINRKVDATLDEWFGMNYGVAGD